LPAPLGPLLATLELALFRRPLQLGITRLARAATCRWRSKRAARNFCPA